MRSSFFLSSTSTSPCTFVNRIIGLPRDRAAPWLPVLQLRRVRRVEVTPKPASPQAQSTGGEQGPARSDIVQRAPCASADREKEPRDENTPRADSGRRSPRAERDLRRFNGP